MLFNHQIYHLNIINKREREENHLKSVYCCGGGYYYYYYYKSHSLSWITDANENRGLIFCVVNENEK